MGRSDGPSGRGGPTFCVVSVDRMGRWAAGGSLCRSDGTLPALCVYRSDVPPPAPRGSSDLPKELAPARVGRLRRSRTRGVLRDAADRHGYVRRDQGNANQKNLQKGQGRGSSRNARSKGGKGRTRHAKGRKGTKAEALQRHLDRGTADLGRPNGEHLPLRVRGTKRT